MVLYRRSRVVNATYFLTATLRDRRASWLTDRIDDLRGAFRETRTERPFQSVAIAVMPEHFHWLCRLSDEDADFSTRIRMIKRGFTRRLLQAGIPLGKDGRGEYRLWQRRFWEHTIRDEQDLERLFDYVHYNPVKHGLVRSVKDWPHSSFHRYVRQGLLDLDWGGHLELDDGSRNFGEPTGPR